MAAGGIDATGVAAGAVTATAGAVTAGADAGEAAAAGSTQHARVSLPHGIAEHAHTHSCCWSWQHPTRTREPSSQHR
jgi:hypothetical protein